MPTHKGQAKERSLEEREHQASKSYVDERTHIRIQAQAETKM